MATLALSLSPGFGTVATVGVVGIGIGSSAMSTMFSLGSVLAERTGIKRSTFNAYMRAATSTSWMVGRALSFVIADQFSAEAVFRGAFAISLVWLALWWWTAPRDAANRPASGQRQDMEEVTRNPEVWMAILFVF